MKFFGMLLSLMGLLIPARAELPLSAYLQMQAAAPEKIEIKVEKVKHQHLFRRREVVSAVVTKVAASNTGLKAGDKIEIKYRHAPLRRGAVGPSPVPRLGKGMTYPAWLSRSGEGYYEPAARGMSFEKVDKR